MSCVVAHFTDSQTGRQNLFLNLLLEAALVLINLTLGGIIVLNHHEPPHQLQLRLQRDNTYFQVIR